MGLPKNGQKCAPLDQICPSNSGKNCFSPPLSSFPPVASRVRDANENGEMPMSPPNCAADPPPLLVRSATREPPSSSCKTGGGVTSGQQRSCVFSSGDGGTIDVQKTSAQTIDSERVNIGPQTSIHPRGGLCADISPSLVQSPTAQTSVQENTHSAR